MWCTHPIAPCHACSRHIPTAHVRHAAVGACQLSRGSLCQVQAQSAMFRGAAKQPLPLLWLRRLAPDPPLKLPPAAPIGQVHAFSRLCVQPSGRCCNAWCPVHLQPLPGPRLPRESGGSPWLLRGCLQLLSGPAFLQLVPHWPCQGQCLCKASWSATALVLGVLDAAALPSLFSRTCSSKPRCLPEPV